MEWEGTKNRVVVSSRLGDSSFRYGGYYYDSLFAGRGAGTAELNQVIHFGYSLQADGTIAQKENFAGDQFASAVWKRRAAAASKR